MPRVSVLMTSYKRPTMCIEAIDSVLAQNYSDWELLVGDDNSPEQDRQQIEDYIRKIKDKRIHYYQSGIPEEKREEKTRYAEIINTLYKMSSGEFISYLCDDDLFMPRKLSAIVNEFDSCSWKDVLCGLQKCCLLQDSGEKIVLDSKTGSFYDIRAYPANSLKGGIIVQPAWVVDHSSVVVRRKVIEIIGGENAWDTDRRWNTHADSVFFMKLIQSGYYFYVIPEILDEHRYHKNCIGGSGIVNEILSKIDKQKKLGLHYKVSIVSR